MLTLPKILAIAVLAFAMLMSVTALDPPAVPGQRGGKSAPEELAEARGEANRHQTPDEVLEELHERLRGLENGETELVHIGEETGSTKTSLGTFSYGSTHPPPTATIHRGYGR